MKTSYIALDLETTGLDPQKDQILEIGAVKIQDGKETERYETFVRVGIPIPEKIQELTGTMPLVLHGGTGIPEDMIKKAISLGVSKINVNTECQLSFAAATRKYIEAGKDLEGKGFDPRKLLAPGFEAIKATVKEKMELFGSVNKA